MGARVVWSSSCRFCSRLVWRIADLEGFKKPSVDDEHYRLDDCVATAVVSKSRWYSLPGKGGLFLAVVSGIATDIAVLSGLIYAGLSLLKGKSHSTSSPPPPVSF